MPKEQIGSLEKLLLPALADALLLLTLCLNYRRVYTWQRSPLGAPPGEIEIMTEYPVAIRVRVDQQGTIYEFGTQSFIAADPRGPLRETVTELFDFYNLLAASATPPHPTIYFRTMQHDDQGGDST